MPSRLIVTCVVGILVFGALVATIITPIFLRKNQDAKTTSASTTKSTTITTTTTTTTSTVITCEAHSCQNGGICEETNDSIFCACLDGFSGDFCEIGPCPNNPCEYGGACSFFNGSFVCSCLDGFSGERCETTPCSGDPCEDDAICTITGNTYVCSCKDWAHGESCVITQCSYEPCKYGECMLFGEKHLCKCPSDMFSGRRCEINPCEQNSNDASKPPACFNDGVCSMDGDDFKCDCPEFYSGKRCEIHPCMDFPCQNGGACEITGDDSFICDCPLGASGNTCEEITETTNKCFDLECDGVCLEMKDGQPKCFGNSLVGFVNNDDFNYTMSCGPIHGSTMATSPEIKIHHFDIVPSFRKNEYFINTHGCGNTGNCRASFPKGRVCKSDIRSREKRTRLQNPEKTSLLKVDSFFTKKKMDDCFWTIKDTLDLNLAWRAQEIECPPGTGVCYYVNEIEILRFDANDERFRWTLRSNATDLL
ncbi:Oidioi.mRNA.OKI2018_I69.chr1.g1553.t1.cds [Oikopleura dioica]|uniref:Oidioi.mRNA.OKI2018_I69.chr1.g1553.t1.cds n=1 Tax=Oikopleura dioica TaxID=34765 RepID=A0ABN7SV93_OIKDI|nr:Oidioi.mRNA.OKI2018_I69.chr1.g1553.t1.cds [Oikopleura dioica]